MFTNAYLFVKSFIQKLSRDRITNYSASSAFFLILSLFPFLILLLTLIQYTPLTKEFLIDRLDYFIPDIVFPLIKQIIEEIYSTTLGTTLIFVSAITGIWSASKGIVSIIRGLNVSYNINDKRSWIRVRLLACLYTVVLIVFVIVALVLLVFGSYFYNLLFRKTNLGAFLEIIKFLLKQKWWVLIILLTLFYMLIYKFLPAKRNHFLQMFPGAILASGANIGLSELFSMYVKSFPNFTYTYGSLTTFIILMLMLYFVMYIMFICADINFYFKSWLERMAIKRKRKKTIKYEIKKEKKEEKKEEKKMQH